MKHNILSNKVKTVALVVVLAYCGSSLTSCNDFLEVEPQNIITQEQFWNEETDVKNIIAGCYSGMASYGMISRMMIWGEFRSENVINNGDITQDVNLERLLKENIVANNGYTSWVEFYSIINRCNTVIEYAPKVAERDPSYTKSELKADIAEVTAIRSLCYFYLIRTFRDVPYSEVAFLDDNQQLAQPATPFDEVLNNLIVSLENVKNDAITKYGNATGLASYYNTGRVTKKLIYALLCEMYLWKKDYTKCVEYADLIIKQMKQTAKDNDYPESYFKYVNGYPLIMSRFSGTNVYGNSFNTIFVDGNSMESIFEINFDKQSGDAQMSNGPASDFFGATGRTPYVTYSSYVGTDQKDAIYNVFASRNNGLDARAYENMNVNVYYINKHSCYGGVNIPGGSDAYKSATYVGLYPTAGPAQESRNKANYIIYRLTDIMLLKAEALTQMMQDSVGASLSDEDKDYRNRAFDLINAVNKRSLLQQEPKDTLVLGDYTSKAAITNLVYEERHRELMFEGKRFFDLVRRSQRDGNTDYLRSKVANKSIEIKSIIESKMQKMDAIYWPYNLEEIKVNPYLKQNSAFGSGENSSYETTK